MDMQTRVQAVIVFLSVFTVLANPLLSTGQSIDSLAKLRDTAECARDHIRQQNFERYMKKHDIYVIKTKTDSKEMHRGAYPPYIHYSQTAIILNSLRGKAEGQIKLGLEIHEESNILSAGRDVIVLGNWHKIGFNVICFWNHSKETEAFIKKVINGNLTKE